MRISYKADYALKTMLELALHYDKGVLSIHELAKRGDIPDKFLEQVLLILKKGGFVKSKRGISGGYLLAHAPEDITIGDVVRFIEGPVEPVACVETEHYRGCKDVSVCVFRDVWKEIKDVTTEIIDKVTFAELVKKTEQKKKPAEEFIYSI